MLLGTSRVGSRIPRGPSPRKNHAKAAVSTPQRLSRAQGHPRLRSPQREVDDREPIVLSHRSTGNYPKEMDHRERADDGRVQRHLVGGYPGDRRQAVTMTPARAAPMRARRWSRLAGAGRLLAGGLLVGALYGSAGAEG